MSLQLILFYHVQLGLVYCMDYLEKNIDWLESKLKPLLKGQYSRPTLAWTCNFLFFVIINHPGFLALRFDSPNFKGNSMVFFWFDLAKAGPLDLYQRNIDLHQFLWVFNYYVEINLFPYHFVCRVCDCFLIYTIPVICV